MRIYKITTEGMEKPLGLDAAAPTFGWKAESEWSRSQSAYQIQVTEDQTFEMLSYDTGKVEGNKQCHIMYAGPALTPKTRYYVRVRIWDEQGNVSDFSDSTWFETGLLDTVFAADWIEPEQNEGAQEPECRHLGEIFMPREVVSARKRLEPAQYIRREFETAKEVKKARFYASAHGIYELYINGEKISHWFAPEITSYQNRLWYQTYDVTEHLRNGTNVIGAIIADGWYIGRIGLSGDSHQYGKRLGFIGQLELEFEDGTTGIIKSDEQFCSSTGKYLYSDFCIGEMQDLRKEQKGFAEPGFDDSRWKMVKKADYKKDHLVGQSIAPVKILEQIPAQRIFRTPKGEWVVDFGIVIAGIVEMKACGTAEDVITLEHFEVLDEQGNYMNNIGGRNNDQTDICILSGAKEESFRPAFTFHGFRYVKVSGYPGKLKKENFKAYTLGSELEETLTFRTSNETLNRLVRNIRRSQIGNMLSLPSDCPQRERSGFTGDAQVYGTTGCYHMDLSNFLRDWLADVRWEQLDNGEIPNIVPNFPKMRDLQQRANGCQHSAGWGDGCVSVPSILYWAYGDKRVLEENYEMMERWIGYIQTDAEGYIWKNDAHFGDWLTPSLTKYGMEIDSSYKDHRYITATCYYAYSVHLIAEISEQLGELAKAEQYRKLLGEIKTAFAETFNRSGRLTIDMQGMYVLAVAMDMVSEEIKEVYMKRLEELIAENGNRLDTGFMSIRFLLPLLHEHGNAGLAKKLLYQRECPSWFYQIDQGATTIWEKWDAIKPDGMVNRVSFNHYAFGCVGEFLYGYIAGIRPAEPGYRKIYIKPDFSYDLSELEMEYDSIYGIIGIKWKLLEKGYDIQIRVPFNTSAQLELPDGCHYLVAGSYRFFIETLDEGYSLRYIK